MQTTSGRGNIVRSANLFRSITNLTAKYSTNIYKSMRINTKMTFIYYFPPHKEQRMLLKSSLSS
ncbi:MAG: hypothetical protein ACXQTR_00390, partial [Candidatus Methanospirareceae archaeon]